VRCSYGALRVLLCSVLGNHLAAELPASVGVSTKRKRIYDGHPRGRVRFAQRENALGGGRSNHLGFEPGEMMYFAVVLYLILRQFLHARRRYVICTLIRYILLLWS